MPTSRSASGLKAATHSAVRAAAFTLPTPVATATHATPFRLPSRARHPSGRASGAPATETNAPVRGATSNSVALSSSTRGGTLAVSLASGSPGGHVQQGPHEGGGVVRLQVVLVLAHADELDGDSQLPRYGQEYAALGGAVQLGDDHAGQLHGLVEAARLLEPVLSRDEIGRASCR